MSHVAAVCLRVCGDTPAIPARLHVAANPFLTSPMRLPLICRRLRAATRSPARSPLLRTPQVRQEPRRNWNDATLLLRAPPAGYLEIDGPGLKVHLRPAK